MGWFYDYRPYVSVAQRRLQAQREVEKRRKKGLVVLPITIGGRLIAKTFWGKAWCENLESYSDFENRLPRGRTYVRNGSVVHLEIQPGKIAALVSGSELYSVEITISSLPDPHWKCVKSECAGQIGSLVELLQGRLSKSVMDVVTRRGGGLFPKPAEIKMKCSCPDWAGMCKHIAAVMYGVGARLDDKPELLFLLRKVDHLELIAGAVDSAPVAAAGKSRGKKTIASGDLADVFGIEMAEPEAPAPAPTAALPTAKTTKKTAKPRIDASKSASGQKATRAGAGSKKVAGALVSTKKKPKAAATKRVATLKGRAKPAARKRTI
jgi:uncharacterized Zn finger protein